MSENSQMLLRHILEAPYPEDSDVSISVWAKRIIHTNCLSAFKLFPRAASPVRVLSRPTKF
jgi:hypothetical protein